MRNAEAEAQQMLMDAGMTEVVPVPVEQLVSWAGAQLAMRALPANVSGMLIRDDSRQVVAINAGDPKTRQRFTMAHELGHLRMHRGVFVDTFRVNERNVKAHQGTDLEEIQANAFAAELLMPNREVVAASRELLRSRGALSEPELVERLAKRFDVSHQAMSIRLVNLGIGQPA